MSAASWLFRLLMMPFRRRNGPPPLAQPQRHDGPVIATCYHCRRSFVAHCGSVDTFRPRSILDADHRIICQRCKIRGTR